MAIYLVGAHDPPGARGAVDLSILRETCVCLKRHVF